MNWIWIGVIVALLLIELVSLNFTAIWFVISAIISFILLKFNNDYIVQVLTFVILGSLLMIIIRPKVIDKLIKIRDELLTKEEEKAGRNTFNLRFDCRSNVNKNSDNYPYDEEPIVYKGK